MSPAAVGHLALRHPVRAVPFESPAAEVVTWAALTEGPSFSLLRASCVDCHLRHAPLVLFLFPVSDWSSPQRAFRDMSTWWASARAVRVVRALFGWNA